MTEKSWAQMSDGELLQARSAQLARIDLPHVTEAGRALIAAAVRGADAEIARRQLPAAQGPEPTA